MRQWLLRISSASALIMIVCGLLQYRQDTHPLKCARAAQKQLETVIFENSENEAQEDAIAQMKLINPDFRTFLAFESGLIRLPVVQGTDNHWYLDHLFDGTEGVIGTLFFDVQCEMDDPVRIIYGHSVFSEPTMMFTPLHQLCSQSFFEQNRIFTLDDGETAETYEIISVFINDEALPDALDTRIRCFADDDARRAFLHDAQMRSLVHSLMHEETEGRIIILQTCMDAQAEQRLCAVALEKKG